MIQSNFKYIFATSVKGSDYKISPFVHKLAKTYLFRDHGFHTPVEWKIGYKITNKQVIILILIMNIAFYIYGNIRLKQISILNSFELLRARRNEKEMKVKAATSFKLLTIFIHKKIR